MTDSDQITFSFGKNWRSFVDTVTEDSISGAMKDIEDWLGPDAIAGKSVLDIGSGSGIHSLCFHLLGAKELLSVDVDPHSVESTQLMRRKAGNPANWRVTQGSILDKNFVGNLLKHDIVYSWGVLHHTGAMWDAIDNTCSLVANNGLLLIAIYVKGAKYQQDLRLKQSYNRASGLGKRLIEWTEILKIMRTRWRSGQNPLKWNQRVARGMDVYHDLIDWLGGLPYEVATKDEIITFCVKRGFSVERFTDYQEGMNNWYLFSRSK
jgi:SAM-dependent methyltransferase